MTEKQLKAAIIDIFDTIKGDQLLSPTFVLELIDITTDDLEWLDLSDGERFGLIMKAFFALENEGKVASKASRVKQRWFNDDEVKPILPKKVTTYQRVLTPAKTKKS